MPARRRLRILLALDAWAARRARSPGCARACCSRASSAPRRRLRWLRRESGGARAATTTVKTAAFFCLLLAAGTVARAPTGATLAHRARRRGRARDRDTQDCRIVSLAPGTTAMLYAAGAGHCLVGTIAHSVEPAEAARIKVVGDAETLDFEQLLALRPTVVVVAVDVVQRMRIDRIRSMGIPVYQVHVTRLAGMPESVERLGALTGTAAAANASAAALRSELDALGNRYRERAPVRVLYQIWDRPIYTIGGKHVITDALKLCGAVNIFDDLGTAAPAVTREAVVLRDPELILASAPPAAGDGGSLNGASTRHWPPCAAGSWLRTAICASTGWAHRSSPRPATCAPSSTARARPWQTRLRADSQNCASNGRSPVPTMDLRVCCRPRAVGIFFKPTSRNGLA